MQAKRKRLKTRQERARAYVKYLNEELDLSVSFNMIDKFVEFADSEEANSKFERVKKSIVCKQCDVGAETMVEISKHWGESGHTGCSVRLG
jgi:hypothetical protein